MRFKWISCVSIPVIAAGIVPVFALTSCSPEEKIKVIIDTDVGNDCDDIGALTVLGNAYKKNLVDVVAVTVCNQSDETFFATDIMLERYGIDCPMGQSRDDQPIVAIEYAQKIAERWTARSKTHPERKQAAVNVLRKALAENKGQKIKLITLGMLNNISALLNSPGDEISPKTGRELFEENVSDMVLMGGRFDAEMETYSEFNIIQNKQAAINVINTTNVPKTFLGWEVGEPVKSGLNFYNNPDTPQYVAYDTYNHGLLRQSWDPLTMYIGIVDCWGYSEKGNVEVVGDADDEANTIFTPSASGICRYVPIYENSAEIAMKLEAWMSVAK